MGKSSADKAQLITLKIAIDNWRLFDPVKGWFREGPDVQSGDWKKTGANYWTHDSHPARAELITPEGKTVFAGTVDFRLFGGLSRIHPQKSFSLSCRKKYGQSRIKYPVFGESSPPEFKYLIARNAGSDWSYSYLRDALLTDLLDDPSWELDLQAARPARVYVNGQYWGLYHLREKINPHYLAERYGIADKDDIDLLEGRGGVKHGYRKDYDELVRFIRRHDLSDPAAYAEVRRQMNIDNFQRLQIAQTYFDNQDAGGNLRYWRDRTDPNSRWRWILYDVDQGFGLHSDTAYQRNTVAFFTDPHGPAWPNPPWSTLIHRQLLKNPNYRQSFVNRSLDYLHTDFLPEKVVATIDRHADRVAAEISQQSKRWGIKQTYWPSHVERLREFGRQRPKYLREHLRQHFNGGPDRLVEITADMGGFVTLNENITIEDEAFIGHYFQNFPLQLRATPRRGYRFVGWEDDSSSPERSVALRDAGDRHLRASFELVEPGGPTAQNPAPATAQGLTTMDIMGRLSVALFVFGLIAVYGTLCKG
ncbi:hypothetical protein GGR27_003006 [Lewinella antarctica]|uniref:Bacterial repeat domain-containing protein n=2 Tax=Neolewinella antarctica TaxID=442734 RepID=A0ABX0XDV3_9BACT|nr:hypothetical protein [Neolewinella antarctica]